MKKIILTSLLLCLFNFTYAEKIIFSANSMTGKTGDSETSTILNGNAYIKTESMEIKADRIELAGADYQFIIATGSVEGINTEAHMEFTCDTMNYDRTTKVAELKGSVNLIDKDNDVKAKAQMIEYDQEKDIAVLQININLIQKDNVCEGLYATYYKKDQILELSGNAHVKQGSDDFRAQSITLDMDTQDIKLGGNVSGTVTTSKEKKDNKNAEATEKNDENLSAPEDSEITENTEEQKESSVDAEKTETETATDDKN